MRLQKTKQPFLSRVALLGSRHCGYVKKPVCQIACSVKEPSFPAVLRRPNVVSDRRRIEQFSRQTECTAITWYMAATSGGAAREKTDLRSVLKKVLAKKLRGQRKNRLEPLTSICNFGCRGFEILFRSEGLRRPLISTRGGQPW